MLKNHLFFFALLYTATDVRGGVIGRGIDQALSINGLRVFSYCIVGCGKSWAGSGTDESEPSEVTQSFVA